MYISRTVHRRDGSQVNNERIESRPRQGFGANQITTVRLSVFVANVVSFWS
jgi:hypothetical protein